MRLSAVQRIVVAASLVAVAGCASKPGSMAEAYRDPYEKFNRKVYALNKGLDRYALLPGAKVYRASVPAAARRGVAGGLANLDEPLNFANAGFQGKPKEAGRTFARFMINTILGVAGLVDVATDWGLPAQPEDFGQTFAVWGIPSGPYLMLPFFGPSTLREGVGLAIEQVVDPVPYVRNRITPWHTINTVEQFGLKALNLRSNLIDAGADSVLAGSLDEYATVRSAYLQRRQSLIYDGNPPDDDDSGDAPPLPAKDAATKDAGNAAPVTPAPAAADAPTPQTPPAASPK
ncbi:MAG: VacJ family lipoprotein [Sphingomonadaceae bacterium]|nr:VacJ family lipoprotein [Sphingomonadaceae bacterium]